LKGRKIGVPAKIKFLWGKNPLQKLLPPSPLKFKPTSGVFKRGISPSYFIFPLMIGIYIHIMERGNEGVR